jgi:hypothetical protein
MCKKKKSSLGLEVWLKRYSACLARAKLQVQSQVLPKYVFKHKRNRPRRVLHCVSGKVEGISIPFYAKMS